MKLADQLGEDARVVSLPGGDAGVALSELMVQTFGVDPERAARVGSDLAEGRRGEITLLDAAAVCALQADFVHGVTVMLGLADGGLHFGPSDPEAEEVAESNVRILVLVVTPRRITALRDQALPTLVRFFKDREHIRRFLAGGTSQDLRTFGALLEIELREHFLVADAMREVQYRVYPDTPFSEIADLIVRRGLHAVPVVGKDYEFLGIITTGDAMEHLLPRTRKAQADPNEERVVQVARDVMTRSVMCVSEDQSLVDAANTMVNRDVEQLPVIREGQLVGSIDRHSVLELLFGQVGFGLARDSSQDEEQTS